jgi:RNA polymerase sigma-70 factor (ECF subfamily)
VTRADPPRPGEGREHREHEATHAHEGGPAGTSSPGAGELWARLRAGSRSAFDDLFRSHYPKLVATAQLIVGERAVAEELAQDVMLELWRRRATLVLESTLPAYLHRSARNRALNYLRHERVARQAEPGLSLAATPPPGADHEVRRAELETAVRAAVASLPARCREVFELSRTQGLRYAEIASAMDISVKTVEAQMAKALRIMRERLAPWLPESEI